MTVSGSQLTFFLISVHNTATNRVEAVGRKSSKLYFEKLRFFCVDVKVGAISQNINILHVIAKLKCESKNSFACMLMHITVMNYR